VALVYNDFQNQTASEKIGLCQLEASKRLVGWELDSGVLYKISFEDPVIVDVVDSGTTYTEVSTKGAVSAGEFFHDRQNKELFLQALDSSNPNSRFLVVTIRLFFSNVSVIESNDLSTGFDVEWQPFLRASSNFGVEIDNTPRQLGIGVESKGFVSFHNKKDFWRSRYDKLFFENNRCLIFSWNRTLPITEAKLIFQGRIQEKNYTTNEVKFDLKDFLNALRSRLELGNLGDVAGALVPSVFARAKQRQVYGFVNGFRPQNIQQADRQTGFTLAGTITADAGDLTKITGSGVDFLRDFRPNDTIFVLDVGIKITVQSITSTTELRLSSPLSVANANAISAKGYNVIPALSKTYINRKWQIAAHALREPIATIVGISAPNLFRVDTIADFEAEDQIIINGIIGIVSAVVGTERIRVSGQFGVITPTVTTITRLTVTNLRINDETLIHTRDFLYDATLAQITLETDAEFNLTTTKSLTGTVDYTSGLRTVLGTGTSYTTQLDFNSFIEDPGAGDFLEVVEIISDTELLVKIAPGSTTSILNANFKKPIVFREETDVLSCDVIGATEDGTVSGVLIKTAPQLVKDVLTKAGLSSDIDTASFDTAKDLLPQKIGLVIPDQFTKRTTISHRKIISQVNRSVFGVLISNPDFKLEYQVLEPSRGTDLQQFNESDIIGSFKIKSDSKKVSKTVTVNYNVKEFDFETRASSEDVVTSTSDIAQFLAKVDKLEEIDTVLVNTSDAQIISNRWAFFLEVAQNFIDFNTKLQGSRLKVTDKIDFKHEFLFERFASTFRRKVGEVIEAKKDPEGAFIKIEDLGAALSRCATITENTADDFSAASEDELIINGYITDEFGMQDNDASTHGINVIW